MLKQVPLIAASELMYDDWVLDELTKIPLQVNGGIISHVQRNHNRDVVLPMPLTAEIMEANGFVLMEGSKQTFRHIFVKENYRFRIAFSHVNGVPLTYDNIALTYRKTQIVFSVRYVHELQNLLRVLGYREKADKFITREYL